ncbi:MAG: hypothetical protein KKA90_02845 [Nanoarchaeota archaeon]|nr:hypothetical protein [Nanoarchaeota archaeon]
MVFARAKLLMEDQCFDEDPGTVEIKLIGPDLQTMYQKCYDLLKSVFNVPDADIQETNYSWGKSEKGDKFKVRWWLHKDLDLFSYFYIRFELAGEGNEKQGNLMVRIRGLLRTEYPQDTLWQRSLFYEMLRVFWHRIFYHRRREIYAEECRHGIVLYQKKVKALFTKLTEKKEV